MIDRIGDFALTDPITTLILGGCVIFLLAAGLAAITAHLVSEFERKVYANRYYVLRTREQKVTEREFRVKEREQDLGREAHDTYGLAQVTLSQMNDDTEIDILKWEQL